MSRYERERKKRDLVLNGKAVARRQATMEEATRELSAAVADLREQLLTVQSGFLRRVNDAWRRRSQ